MEPDAEILVDLQRPDGSTVGIFTRAEYRRLPLEAVADTTAQLFVRCGCGKRVDIGSWGQLVRALHAAEAAAELAAARVAPPYGGSPW